MYIKDLEGNEFTCQITTTQKYILNSNITLSAEILPSKVNKPFINKIEKMWRLYDDDNVEHIILFTKRQGKGDLLTVKIDAIPRILDVMETTRIYEEYNQHMTANAAFTILFNALPFNFTLVDNFPAQDWEGFGAGETTLETFKRCLERYGAEYEFVGNRVYLYKIVGRDTQFQYRHRLNADNILEETDANSFYTYAKGYGDYADGEENENGGWQNAALIREYTSPIADIPSIGIRHAPPIKNGNIKVSTFMMDQLKTLVDTSLAISVSANIYDLRQQGYELAQPELGDRVFLIDERIEFNETVRIVEIEITKNYRREITELKLTFGTPGLVQRYLSKFNTAAKNITEIFSGQKQLPESAYSAAVKQATKDLTNARSELVFPDQGGIWSVDPSNPNYMTAFTSKGFGVSEDGGGNFKSALTGRGLVAEQIYGKIIAGDRLEIRNQEGTFIVDGGLVTIAGGALNILGGITDANIASAEQWNGQGTYIDDKGVYTGTLTANQVRVGFNNITRGTQIVPAGLETYSGGELTSRLTGVGHHFYKGEVYGGFIGIIPRTTQPEKIGLSFNMRQAMDFLAWTHDDDNDGTYTTKLTWAKDNTIDFTAKGFNFYDDVRMMDKLTVNSQIEATSSIKSGSRAKIQSSSNGSRLYASDNVWLYVNESGQVGVNINGTAYAIYNP